MKQEENKERNKKKMRNMRKTKINWGKTGRKIRKTDAKKDTEEKQRQE